MAADNLAGKGPVEMADYTIAMLERKATLTDRHSPEVRRQATETAQMLRDLKQNDPVAYEKFGSAMKAGKNNDAYYSMSLGIDGLTTKGPDSLKAVVQQVIDQPDQANKIINQSFDKDYPRYEAPKVAAVQTVASASARMASNNPRMDTPPQITEPVRPQARIITPGDTNRPPPIAPVYRQVSPNPMPSFEERVAAMGARIKELEGQPGMNENKARVQVQRERQSELESGGMDRNTARSVMLMEAKEEKRIDNAQERGMQQQRAMGSTLGGFAAQMLGLKGNEAAALRRGAQMVGGMIGNDGVQAPAAQDVRGLAGVGLKEISLKGVEAKAAQVAVNVGAGVVSGTGPATPSAQDVRGLTNAGIREAGLRGPEAQVAQAVVGSVAANAASYTRTQVTEYPQRSERTGYVASPRIDRTFDIEQSRQVGPIMAAAANDGTTDKARAEIKQDQEQRAALAVAAPKPEPEQPINGRFDNDTYARARQFTGPGGMA